MLFNKLPRTEAHFAAHFPEEEQHCLRNSLPGRMGS